MSTKPCILISGGGGYLGSMLAQDLAILEGNIFLADIAFNDGSRSLARKYNHINLLELDLTRADDVKNAVLAIQPDYIYHFASLIDRTRDFRVFDRMYEVNVKGTFHLLMALENIDYQMLGFSSTSEVYGLNNLLPFREDQLPQPVSPYSLTKLMAEKLIETFSLSYSKPYTIFRIFNFYGPQMPSTTFIPQLLESIRQNKRFEMTPGEQKRDYLYISDLIWYLTHILLSGIFKNEVVNLCSNQAISMREIAHRFEETYKDLANISYTLPYRKNEIWEIRGDNSKIRTAFPAHKNITLEEGLSFLFHD